MKYYVENWETCETIAVFNSEKERDEFLYDVTIELPCKEGRFLKQDTSIRISIYECE